MTRTMKWALLLLSVSLAGATLASVAQAAASQTAASKAVASKTIPSGTGAKEPDCFGPQRWAANMAIATLKNAGVTDNEKIDVAKTQAVKIASEKIGKDTTLHEDLYRQVQKIVFTEKSGNVLEVVTVSGATRSECSMGAVEVLLLSKHLNSDGKNP